MLEMNTTQKQSILLVELDGVLDSQTASDFKAWIEEKIIEGFRAFGLNCHELKYISSRGIGALMELNQILRLKRGKIVLYQVRSEVEKLLEFLKLTDDIPVYSDPAQVEDKLKELPGEEAPEPPSGEGGEKVTIGGPSPEPVNEPVDEEGDDEEEEIILLKDDPAEGEPTDAPEAAPSAPASAADEAMEGAESSTSLGDFESESKTVYCPNCGVKLNVSRPGRYLCPDCRLQFQYPFN